MGIVVRDTVSGELSFLQKGADVVMARIVQRNDWLEEETANMAREGLRTLVVARRKLSEAAYEDFKARHHAASVRLEARNEAMAAVVAETLERDLELLGLTGVEDKLQDDVRGTLELLRNAGIKIWMLTGDKIETATVIAISTKLVARNQYIHQVAKRELYLYFCPGSVLNVLDMQSRRQKKPRTSWIFCRISWTVVSSSMASRSRLGCPSDHVPVSLTFPAALPDLVQERVY